MLRVLDPDSRIACRRFLMMLTLLASWALILSPSAVCQRMATMTFLAGIMVAAVAAIRREPFMGASLNRWDEAVALFGVQLIARAVA